MVQGRAVSAALGFALATGLLAGAAGAQVLAVDLSSDVPFVLGAGTFGPGAVVTVPAAGPYAVVDLGTLPANANVTAFHELDDGRRLFSLESCTALPGGVTADRDDVVQYDGASYSIFFDGAAAGLPTGARIDAIGWRRQGGVASLLLSFDVTVALPGGLTAEDEDVVAWAGGAWALAFDGSAAGISPELDLDGYDRDPVTGTVFASFDGSGRLPGLDFDDDDVLAWDGSTWSLALAGDVVGPSFAAGDLDALAVVTPNIFRDGFESGTTVEWSAAAP